MDELPESIADVADVDCTRTRALVTGSTSGIGRATALGRLGPDVISRGRDPDAGATVVDELATLSDAARGPGTARRLWTYSADVLGIDEPLRDVAGEGG